MTAHQAIDPGATNRPEEQPAPPYLVYEADCRLCSTTARWLQASTSGALTTIPFGDHRVPPALDADRTRVHYVEADCVLHGGAAVTRALRSTRFAPLARLLDAPLLARGRDLAYRAVARVHRRG